MPGPTGSLQQAQRRRSLSYLCQVSCCNSRRSTGIQRGEHGQLIPATTLSSGLVGHRRRASAYACIRVGVRARGAAKTFDDVTEKFRRVGVVRARTWKSREASAVEIQSRRNVAPRFFQDEWSSSPCVCARGGRGEGRLQEDVLLDKKICFTAH